MSRAKRLNRLRCHLEGQTRVSLRNLILDGIQIPTRGANFEEEHVPIRVKYGNYTIVDVRRRCGPLPNYFEHLLLLLLFSMIIIRPISNLLSARYFT